MTSHLSNEGDATINSPHHPRWKGLHQAVEELKMILIAYLVVAIIASMIAAVGSFGGQGPGAVLAKGDCGENRMEILILYDNNAYRRDLKTGWGFSCLVKGLEKNILFDTGGSGSVLMRNMEKMGVSPEQVDTVVLSHIHGDHTGGLEAFLQANPRVTVYLPQSFPANFKQGIKSYGAKVVPVTGPVKIIEKAYSTGEMGVSIREQSLLLLSKKGTIVITGCAHPGIVKIITMAKALTKQRVLLVMGGFHLGGAAPRELEAIISKFRDLGVRYVGPCHCSGDSARAMFEDAYEDHFIDVGVGRAIKIRELY